MSYIDFMYDIKVGVLRGEYGKDIDPRRGGLKVGDIIGDKKNPHNG